MLGEEIKSIIQEIGYQGDNYDEITQTCFHKLYFDNLQGFEGIFYYEFLQCLQWLSLNLLETDQEEKNEDDFEVKEENVEIMYEKLNYILTEKFKL